MELPLPPMRLPEIVAILGPAISAVEEVLNYGYRAAWKVTASGGQFLVKVDLRAGVLAHEMRAQRHARSVGVPTTDVVSFRDGEAPVLVMRWIDARPLRGCAETESWRAAGRMLRRVHAVPPLSNAGSVGGLSMENALRQDVFHLVQQRRLGPSDGELLLRLSDRLRPILQEARPIWLHGDCQSEHFLLEPNGVGLAAVLDWADAREGDPVMDFAVLTMFDEDALRPVLDGYEASTAMVERVALTLPLFRAARAAAAARWLDSHGYPGVDWPINMLRRIASVEAAR